MPLHLTQHDIEMAHRYARDAMTNLRGVGKKEGTLTKATKALGKMAAFSAGIGVVGLADGFAPGKSDLHVGGKVVPLDGVGGLLGAATAICMEDGAASETLLNFSCGVFGGFVMKNAQKMGQSVAQGKGFFGAFAKPTAPPQVSGQAPLRVISGGKPPVSAPAEPKLTEEELASIGQAVR